MPHRTDINGSRPVVATTRSIAEFSTTKKISAMMGLRSRYQLYAAETSSSARG